MSQAFHARPSELLGVTNPVTAFYLDRAVHGIGAEIEGEMEMAVENVKSTKDAHRQSQAILNKWLRSSGGARYRDPAKGG